MKSNKNIYRKMSVWAIGALFVGSVFSTQAAVTVIDGDAADGDVNSSGVGNITQQYVQVGDNNAVDIAGVLVFQLPTLPDNALITTANLGVVLDLINGVVGWHGRLEGLRFDGSSSAVLPGDWSTTGTLVEENFLTSTTPLGTVNTDVTGDANLASWLGGAGDGDWVFLRMTPSIANPANYQAFRVASANDGTPGDRPVLTLEYELVVPEPSTLAMLGLGSLLILAARRKCLATA